ncbi:MAG: lipid-binding SYLF domain-containing protein [Candidatus Rokuibacteriota bacterium]
MLSATILATGVRSASAQAETQQADQLVERSRLTLESFVADSNLEAFHDLLKRCQGLFLAPQVLRAAFFIGAAGGSGAFLAYDDKAGRWAGPAFYTLGELSFGVQAGGDAAEVAFLAMTERGVKAMLSSSIKLGGDASIAAGPFGIGASAATANLSVDMLSFSRAKGLYGGISLQGAAVTVRGALNRAFYSRDVTPTDILIRHDVSNPRSTPLIRSVSMATAR